MKNIVVAITTKEDKNNNSYNSNDTKVVVTAKNHTNKITIEIK